MGKLKKISEDQVRELAELREQGWSYQRLADRFGLSPAGVHYHCLKEGALSPGQLCGRPTGSTNGRSFGGKGFNGPVRYFSKQEDRELVRRREDGQSISRIAREMDRAKTSVRVRLLTIAREQAIREERVAEAAS
ncbi:hypothetical protein QQS45_00150 [Alteriqipengyuania flavescens]|uniref:hypothetical protein n=1 Tax=Alteriqipengyuania flavescens TaxID=3053610 RepID=UPI0025B47F37|nr:hypothetical protein [Alteriqipengyuania flavescens]WJY18701.1 hypothetical protein QQW98_00150 [Alteriqipengyuania flavescens]WJY24641.1 hypothetical protein QQS45_00150 [Alteriqipengyuania flavescens]